MLDQRLQAVAALVRQGTRVADIGTDHGFLPAFLVKEKNCPFAIASDIRKGPLDAARRTVEKEDLSDKISLRLGDGLSSVSPNEIDDIVIAGMGGETIAAILESAPWVKDKRYQLILQPMSRAECLHQYLLENGFEIQTEQLIQDGKHSYIVLSAQYTQAAPDFDPFSHWKGGFSSPDGRPYWRLAAAYLTKKANGIRKTDEKTAASLSEIAEKLLSL